MSYQEKLLKCKDSYPFDYWIDDFEDGLGCYSRDNADMVKKIFDDLIDSLINLKENAFYFEKEKLFKLSVERLNIIRKEKSELIETMEREKFCDLFDEIAVASGLNPSKYANGEGIATEWREW